MEFHCTKFLSIHQRFRSHMFIARRCVLVSVSANHGSCIRCWSHVTHNSMIRHNRKASVPHFVTRHNRGICLSWIGQPCEFRNFYRSEPMVVHIMTRHNESMRDLSRCCARETRSFIRPQAPPFLFGTTIVPYQKCWNLQLSRSSCRGPETSQSHNETLGCKPHGRRL